MVAGGSGLEEPDRAAPDRGERWRLRLYVAGRTPAALKAFANLKRVCEQHLSGRYTIEVVDLCTDPGAAIADEVFALPTVVRRSPSPDRRVIGDLSNLPRVLRALEIEPKQAA